jgi:hypothetical protein
MVGFCGKKVLLNSLIPTDYSGKTNDVVPVHVLVIILDYRI